MVGLAFVAGLALRMSREPLKGDTRFYRAGAERFLAGESLYYLEDPGGPGYTPVVAYTYPPPFAAASVWMAWLPYPVVRQLWLLAMVGCLVGSGVALARLVGGRGPPRRAPWLVGGLVFLLAGRFVVNDLAHGQVNSLLLLLLLWSLVWAEEGRSAASGALLGAALVVKPTSWLLLVYFGLVRRDARLVASCVGVAGCLLLLPALRYGGEYPSLCEEWFLLMNQFAKDSAAHPANASLAVTLTRLSLGAWDGGQLPFRLSTDVPATLRVTRVLAVLGVGAAFVWLCARRGRHPAAPAGVLLLGALLSPVTWKAHLVVIAVAAAFWGRELTERPRRWSWALYGGCVGLLTLPSRGLFHMQRLEGYGSLTLGLILVFVGVVGRPERDGKK